MAKPASPRRRKAADKSKFDKGAKVEGLDNVTKLAASASAGKAKGIGDNSSGITDDELKRQVKHCQALYSDVIAAKKVYDKANGAWRAGIDIAKEKGAPKDELIEYIKTKKSREDSGDGVIVTHHRNMSRLLRVMGDPLGTQWGLFEVKGDDVIDEKTGKPKSSAMDAELQGQAAWRNKEPRSNNQFQAGTEDYAAWDQGWLNAEAAATQQIGKGKPEVAAAH